jgi:hypothetical protein
MAIDKNQALCWQNVFTQANNGDVGVDCVFALSNAAAGAHRTNSSSGQEESNFNSLLPGITRFRTLQLSTAILFPSSMLRRMDGWNISPVDASVASDIPIRRGTRYRMLCGSQLPRSFPRSEGK